MTCLAMLLKNEQLPASACGSTLPSCVLVENRMIQSNEDVSRAKSTVAIKTTPLNLTCQINVHM